MSAPLSILITAAGAPQSPTLVRHLKRNGEREVRVVGVDMDEDAAGRFFCDAFHPIPPAGARGYREAVLDVVRQERPDAFLNVSGTDVPLIAEMRGEIEALGTRVVVSEPAPLAVANDKYRLYETLRQVDPALVPEFTWPRTLDAFVAAARAMGYPGRDLCFKPHRSKGSRGFRVLSERFDRRELLLHHKPTARYMTLGEFATIFEGADSFPDLLLMEHVEGEACDVMTIAYEGEALLTTVKSRERDRWGVIDRGALIERPELVQKTRTIVQHIPLSYNISLQFIAGKLIEINPRTSTFIYQDDLNEPWLAIKLALGLVTPDEVRAHQARVRFGRRMVRYMDQIFFDPDGSWSD